MARRSGNAEEGFGTDSFLDVVANLVGIMIILVMIAGLRVKHAPAADASVVVDAPQTDDALDELRDEALGLELDIRRAQQEIENLSRTAQAAKRDRDVLAYEIAMREQAIAAKRDGLDRQTQDTSQFETDLRIARGEADSYARELELLRGAPEAAPILLQNYPTPIGQTVFGKEVHFQLRGARIEFIPLDELVELFKQQARARLHKLRDATEMVDTVGPVGGFRLRYTMEKVHLAVDTDRETVSAGTFAQLSEYTVLPVSADLGEPIDQALTPHSQFRSIVAALDPRRTTITIWTYDDSFTAFRRLRDDLHAQGFFVAGRPLRDGQPIGGSPRGTRSSGQ